VRPGPLPGFALVVVRLVLAGLFGFAAYVKLSDPQAFAFSIKGFKLDAIPDGLVTLATFAIPWTEMLCAICLLLGLWTRAAALVLSLLLVVFIGAIASALARDLNVKCGCFGNLELFCKGPLGPCNIVQNTVLLAAGSLLVMWGHGRMGLDGLKRPVESPAPRT
jgi:uncharacterized membrane protein YphA (DoxX/SURF4 family)